MAEITPIRPGIEPVAPEVEKVMPARLETFDEDIKTAIPGRQALEDIRKNLRL